jgi:hypothetical protein
MIKLQCVESGKNLGHQAEQRYFVLTSNVRQVEISLCSVCYAPAI